MGGSDGGNSFMQWLKRTFMPTTPLTQTMSGNNPLKPVTNAVNSVASNLFAPQSSAANVLNKPPTTAESNSLVGYSIDAKPSEMHLNVVKQMFPNLTTDQIQQVMAAKGYAFQPALGGGTWKLVGQGTGQAPTTSYGNTFSGDFTTLAPGERVNVNPGLNAVGGTPTTNGEGQYALTVGTVDKKLDEKGAYKWESYTVKQGNNWVKVYRKVLRGPYSKGGQQQQELKREASAQNSQNGNNYAAASTKGKVENLGNNINQLVTLRANFG